MLVAAPGSVVVCHFVPFPEVTAGWPRRLTQNTSWLSAPDASCSLAAASEVVAVVPGSTCTAQVDPAEVASARVPVPSTKNTLAWSAPVLIAASGLAAATALGSEIVVDCQPWPVEVVTVSAPDEQR